VETEKQIVSKTKECKNKQNHTKRKIYTGVTKFDYKNDKHTIYCKKKE